VSHSPYFLATPLNAQSHILITTIHKRETLSVLKHNLITANARTDTL